MHIKKLLHTISAVFVVAMLSAGVAHAGVPIDWISVNRSEGQPNQYISHDGYFPGWTDAYISGDGYALSVHENSIEVLGTTARNWTGGNMYFNGLVLISDSVPWDTDFYLSGNNVAGFDISRIWVDSNQLYIDFASLSMTPSSRFVINFGSAAVVPEMQTYALMLSGLALVGTMARRRKGSGRMT